MIYTDQNYYVAGANIASNLYAHENDQTVHLTETDRKTLEYISQAKEFNNDIGGMILEISRKANIADIPTKISQLENDKNYLSSIPDCYITSEELKLILNDYLQSIQGFTRDLEGLRNTLTITQAQVKAHSGQIGDIKNDVTGLNSELMNVKLEYSNLKRRLDVLNTAYSDLKYKIDSYLIPIASTDNVGVIKVGESLNITSDGKLNVNSQNSNTNPTCDDCITKQQLADSGITFDSSKIEIHNNNPLSICTNKIEFNDSLTNKSVLKCSSDGVTMEGIHIDDQKLIISTFGDDKVDLEQQILVGKNVYFGNTPVSLHVAHRQTTPHESGQAIAASITNTSMVGVRKSLVTDAPIVTPNCICTHAYIVNKGEPQLYLSSAPLYIIKDSTEVYLPTKQDFINYVFTDNSAEHSTGVHAVRITICSIKQEGVKITEMQDGPRIIMKNQGAGHTSMDVELVLEGNDYYAIVLNK